MQDLDRDERGNIPAMGSNICSRRPGCPSTSVGPFRATKVLGRFANSLITTLGSLAIGRFMSTLSGALLCACLFRQDTLGDFRLGGVEGRLRPGDVSDDEAAGWAERLHQLAALRGIERFCLDFIDRPRAIEAAVEHAATAWIAVAKDLFGDIPAWDGGYPAPRLQVWAPGRLIRIEEDATVLLGPELFRDFFLEADRRIFAAFDFSLIHTHSANFRILPLLASLPELSGIQVLIDPMGPPLQELIGPLRAVQEAGKPLLITHELPDAELGELKRRLSPAGLALERMAG